MSGLINMLHKAKRIQQMTEFLNHRFIWAADVDIKITQNQQSIMQSYIMRHKVRKF